MNLFRKAILISFVLIIAVVFVFESQAIPFTKKCVRKQAKTISAKIITPKKVVAFTRKFIGAGSSIVVGNLACFSIIRGHHTSVRCFTGEKVELKVIDTNKIDDFFANNLKKKFLKPVSERYTSFRDYDMFEYDLEADDLRHDISVEGLCWFSIKGKGQTVRILLPKGVAVKESLSKIR